MDNRNQAGTRSPFVILPGCPQGRRRGIYQRVVQGIVGGLVAVRLVCRSAFAYLQLIKRMTKGASVDWAAGIKQAPTPPLSSSQGARRAAAGGSTKGLFRALWAVM